MAETTTGGRYRVGGKLVDAEGKELKAQAVGVKKEEATDDSLAGVDFASAAARTAAEEAGLTADDFSGATASSADGFTKPDVMALIEARG